MSGRSTVVFICCTAAGIALVGAWMWRGEPNSTELTAKIAAIPATAASGLRLVPRAIGHETADQPWITDLAIADLNADGWPDVVAADARTNCVVLLTRLPDGAYEERSIANGIQGPAHVDAADLDGDGDLDVLVAAMGRVMPSNERIGSVVVLENARGGFVPRVLLHHVARANSVFAGDLDGDGDLDLAVGQFGYSEGEIRWMENIGGWAFKSRILLDLAGTIQTPIVDIDGDGDLDIVGLVSQDWEEVYAFENRGGHFASRVVHGSTNKDFGSSGLAAADVDRDGDIDLVWTNGDAFDYATPGARPWHGLQWLENDGRGRFAFHRIADFSGAYSPVVVDLDGDGDSDVVAVSAFNAWTSPDAASLMWFENDGRQRFVPRVLAHEPTHLVVVKAADMDRDGALELVTGGFCFYPPYDRASRLTLWERNT